VQQLPAVAGNVRGLNRAEAAFERIPAEERALRAIEPLFDLGGRSLGEREFESMRADEAEMQAALKQGNLLPYFEFRNAQLAQREARQRELLKQDFGEWRHAVLFRASLRRLSAEKRERSLALFRSKARSLLEQHGKMESILASTGAYYGNRSARSFWSELNAWCAKHLAGL